jgi:hypothetical protein
MDTINSNRYMPKYTYDENYKCHIYNHTAGLNYNSNFLLVSVFLADRKRLRYCLPVNFNLCRLIGKLNRRNKVKEIHLF